MGKKTYFDFGRDSILSASFKLDAMTLQADLQNMRDQLLRLAAVRHGVSLPPTRRCSCAS